MKTRFLSIDFVISELFLLMMCLLFDCPLWNSNSVMITQAINRVRKGFLLYRAVEDNLCHGLVAAICWLAVIGWRKNFSMSMLEIGCCAIIGCGVDLDHFIQARSLSLQDATSLKHRPFAHSVIFIVIGTAAVYCLKKISTCTNCPLQRSLPWIFFVATASHQLRDSIRRGLWVWPLGATQPLPCLVCALLLLLLPLAMRVLLFRTFVSLAREPSVSAIQQY